MADDASLKDRFAVEFSGLKVRPFVIETDAMTAWLIIAQLQLALRHPQNRGPSAQVVKKLVEAMISQIAQPGTALSQVAEMGWHEQYDAKW